MDAAQVEAVDLATIRKSFRCFWLGAFGLIPVIGVAVAWQALGTFRQVCAVTGEKARVASPIILFVSALVLNPLLHVGMPEFADIVFTLLLIGMFVAWSCGEYFRSSADRWNPARAWAWGGAVFGCIGVALTVLCLEHVYIAAFGRLLRGLP